MIRAARTRCWGACLRLPWQLPANPLRRCVVGPAVLTAMLTVLVAVDARLIWCVIGVYYADLMICLALWNVGTIRFV